MNNKVRNIILTIALSTAGWSGLYATGGPVIKGDVYGGGENAKVAQSTEVTLNHGEVYGDIYGGGALADVQGNTTVHIDSVPDSDKKGMFAGDVFGGGKGKEDGSVKANVSGNTSVKVTGGEIIWNKKLDNSKNIITWGPTTQAQFFNSTAKTYSVDHNIYAGGKYASIIGTWNNEGTSLADGKENTGTSTLIMTRGLLNKELLTSTEWKSAFAEHENPHFYAFGGGYGIFTKAHKSDVQILLPMVEDAGASGGDQQLAPSRGPRRSSGTTLDIITDAYGVAWTTVLGVLGGGYNGHVEETNVLVGDATYAHRVYGGGLGSYEGWTQSSDIATANSTTPNTNVAGFVGTTGKLPMSDAADLQTTHVTIAGGHIHGDVFGGGAGVAPRKLDDVNFTDFTEIARVKGNTLVETISYETYLTSKGTKETLLASHPNTDDSKDAYPLKQRAQVFGNIYGGGDVANVTGNTHVKLFGGDVFGYTFGAGLGRLTTEAADYTTIGNVSGNSTVKTADLVDWTGDWKTGYTEPYKPTAWDDIYGGGRNGVTNGNAEVNIAGGKVGNNIFGGGLGNVDGTNITSADVKGNTTVNVTGGSYQWREIADINGNIKTFIDNQTISQSELLNRMGLAPKLEGVQDFFNYRDLRYTRDHSIYGGGNVACRVGTYVDNGLTTLADEHTGLATVNMQHGLFADADISFTDADDLNLATLCRYLVCENAENTQFGVFGGGYGANTKVSETHVNLNMGKSTGDPALWATYFGQIQSWYSALDDSIKNKYYGGSEGENAYNRYFTARMAKSINVPSHTVLTAAGGGLAGYVAGNTHVTMDGHSGALRVFGGGIGMKPTADELNTLTSDAAAALTYGQVGGNTDVDINAGVVVKNVFGGGAGVESQRKADDSYLDFPGMAHVLGKTDVHVGGYSPSTVVFGKVFGGGDVANVGIKAGDAGATEVSDAQVVAASTGTTSFTAPQAKITIDGGCVFQQVFAGGSGRTKDICDDYTRLGAVYGNTQLVINNSTYTAEQAAAANLAGSLVTGWTNKSAGDTNEPWLWDIVYGGGQNGTVFGNTNVQIQGGNLGYDIFGGGWGNHTTQYNPITGLDEDVITSADVTQNTNVRIAGGKWCLSQSWDGLERSWRPVNILGSNTYSPQYDPATTKFNIDHNIYGGGNVACSVGTYDGSGVATSGGNTYVYVTKGMLVKNAPLGHDYTGTLFEQPEWENIYDKHASPHFSAFGGGFGVDTKVNNTFVKVDMGTDSPKIAPSAPSVAAKEASAKFETLQSLMDVIGGGFEGAVNNTCHVNIDGYTFMRNAFGGAYYATVGNIDVKIVRANMDNVYGGGMMGDVSTNVGVTVGTEAVSPISADDARSWNSNLIINQDVYGANDVSGYVGAASDITGAIHLTDGSDGISIQLNGGHIFGSVYGGGNGNYLYQIDEDVTKVSVVENYRVTSESNPTTIYRVPLRSSDFPSISAMSDQQKLVNVVSYRPSAMKVDINFRGNSATDRLLVDGNIFGGGNSATINDFDGIDNGKEAKVKLNVGSHIKVGGVFIGSNGDALFNENSSNDIIGDFSTLNNLSIYEKIDWTTPENISIPETLLPTPKAKRPDIYDNNMDLYYLPVEMAFMPQVTWGAEQQNNSVNIVSDPSAIVNVPDTESGLTDAEIATFCCGGNRGNMDTRTSFHMIFPEGLTITDKIVGGCNDANSLYQISTTETLEHVGGYLLGSHGVGADHEPQIYLTLRNKFKINDDGGAYAQQCNVFGGCFNSGTVRGDIRIDVYSNMLMSRFESDQYKGVDIAKLRTATDAGNTVCGIYGAGYGNNTWVYGDTEVRLGDDTEPAAWNDEGGYYNITDGASCNYIFGGGRNGNVVGNTNVRILNGRVAGCVIGGSYAGELYGSAQTMVGYPELYYRARVSRSYDILRADEDPVHATYVDDRERKMIQKKVYYTRGDLIAASVYNGIRDKIVKYNRETLSMEKDAAEENADSQLAQWFDEEHSIPTGNNWSNINILIDKAIYGGGYVNATSSGSYTIKKYTDEHKFDNSILADDDIYQFNKTTNWENDTTDIYKYGGNTFVMVGDVSGNYDVLAKTSASSLPAVADIEKERNHIALSSSQLRPLHLSIGDDLFGMFVELTNKEAMPDKYGTDGWDNPEHEAEGREPSGQYMKITTERSYLPADRNNGTRFYEYVGEGGVYGDGRLSISEGFRVFEAMGYGYNGSTPKSPTLMNCIHRFDIARLKDCCISLLGDRDFTTAEGSAANADAFSMARVSEVQMESSINPNENYKDPKAASDVTAKHSRNYVGLSSAQFDLSAIKSNDIFTADDDATFYHNKFGEVISSSMDIEGTDNKKFPGQWSYYKVKKWYLNEYTDEVDKSDYYDDINAQVRNERQFQLRNSATARNMFGVFSGYALNVHTTHYNTGHPEFYYGPVVGVFEIDLIGTREGEAGGYAYAQNIHEENAKDHEGHDVLDTEGHPVHSFFETSGNFVFPATDVRKVVDNCTPIAYNKTSRDAAEAHYWYVTGFKYYYNATITGYTYDGETKFFEADNSTKRLVLTGTKENQRIVLNQFHWLPRHTIEFYANATEYNEAMGTNLSDSQFEELTEDQKKKVNRQESCDIENKYLTRKDSETYDEELDVKMEEWGNTITADDRINHPFYNISLSLNDYGIYQESYQGADVPHITIMPQDVWRWSDNTDDKYKVYEPQAIQMSSDVTKSNPLMGIRLTDCVNNNGKLSDGTSYYEHYLNDPCVAKIVLSTPAINDNGDEIYSNYSEVAENIVLADGRNDVDYNADPYYEIDANGSYNIISLESAKILAGKHINVFQRQKALYDNVNDKQYSANTIYYSIDTEGNYVIDETILNESDFESKKGDLFILKTPAAVVENYVYDITLTIRYIKGPSYDGRIDIKNCALPGEMIRLSHENLHVESDIFSLPHNGSFWTIGPGEKVPDDGVNIANGYHWELRDKTGTLERDAVDAMGTPVTYRYTDPNTRNLYYPYNPNVTDPLDEFRKKPLSPIMSEGLYHDPNSETMKEYLLPAYYFMNGYVAQYSFTVNGIDEVFTTTIHPEDTLLVHNYHRMEKALANADTKEDIKLANSAQAYVADDPAHKHPRVYIQNVEDFQAFAKYLARTANSTPVDIDIRPHVDADPVLGLEEYAAVTAEYIARYGTDYGNNTEFFLMDDIDLTNVTWTAPANFKGILHGNGHVIKGLGNNQALFAALGEHAHIYNLGLTTGKIVSTEVPAKYSCCYTYDTGAQDANHNPIHTVYRMDGTADTHYTEDDWRTGRVAYDLNEFYLAERLDRGEDDHDSHNHDHYVEGLYADGEYRYSRWFGTNTTEYLRSSATPNYAWSFGDGKIVENPSTVSNHFYSYDPETHKLSHKVDEARALVYNVANEPEEYRPLIDEAHVADNGSTLTTKRNDYLFFGQTVNASSYTNPLGTVGSNLPKAIDASARTGTQIGSAEGVTHAVADQTNRVWRAYGFYRSKVDDAFHFNRAAWALHPALTAIDFTGLHDVAPAHTWTSGYAPATADSKPIFYSMVMDMPVALTSFNVGNQSKVTKNLLIYTDKLAVSLATDVSATAVHENIGIRYNQSTLEGNILGHQIQKLDAPDANGNSYATDLLHLVERVPTNSSYCNDFNAPISFTVDTRAWYERQPQAYRNIITNYQNGSAWEGIALPFTATKVSAEKNGEISHFYGNDELHHEYWLRGLKAIADDQATFARPAISGVDDTNYFVESHQTGIPYTYPANSYFTGLYGYNDHYGTRDEDRDDSYNDSDEEWYAQSHTFSNYVPLTAAVPYIVAFPGDDFYEFSMESAYRTGNYGSDTYHQKAIFETGTTSIPVSDGSEITITADGHTHYGTYMQIAEKHGINTYGTAFVADQTVVPFRTYLAQTSSPAPDRAIWIVDNLSKKDTEEDKQPEENIISKDGKLTIYAHDHKIIVRSTFSEDQLVNIYTVTGIRIASFTIAPDEQIVTPVDQQGVYVANDTRVLIL